MNKYFYTFKVDQVDYVYDRYSNLIIEIEPFFRDLIDTYEKHKFNQRDVINTLKGKYSERFIVEKLHEFKKFSMDNDLLKAVDLPTITFGDFGQIKDSYHSLKSQIIVNITEQCNLRCQYCKFSGSYRYARTHTNRSIQKEVLEQIPNFIARYFDSNEEFTLGFYGGEPLLRFNELKWLTLAVKKSHPKCRNALTTNGVLLNSREVIEFLARHHFNIYISLDGEQDIHDRYRVDYSGKGTFHRIFENMQFIREFFPEYYKNHVHYVVTLSPPYDLEKVFSIFTRIVSERNVVRFSHVDANDTSFFDKFDMEMERKVFREQRKFFFERFIDGLPQPDDILDFFFGEELAKMDNRDCFPLTMKQIHPNGACLPGQNRIFITVDGKLGMCEKVSDKLTIGDVFSGFDFAAIENILSQYVLITQKVCSDCFAYRLCASCFLSALEGTKLTEERKKSFCQMKIKQIQSMLERYVQYKNKMIKEEELCD